MTKRSLLVLSVPVMGFVLLLLAKQVKQRQREARMLTFLNLNFASVQAQSGRVRILTRINSYKWRPSADGDPLPNPKTPMILPKGSVFSFKERHVDIFFTVKNIEADGAVLHYQAIRYGGREASGTGTVRLLWK